MLDGLGVSARLAVEGLKLTTFTIRDRDRQLLRIPFGRLPTRYPYLLMPRRTPRSASWRIACRRLAGRTAVSRRPACARADWRRGHARVGGGRAVVTSRSRSARTACTASCGRPSARTSPGIYAESFVLADVRMHWSHGRDDAAVLLPRGPCRCRALPGDFPHRRHPRRRPGAADGSGHPGTVHARGPARGRSDDGGPVGSCFRIHHRLADSHGTDPVPDRRRQHVHSRPGQGMNTGLARLRPRADRQAPPATAPNSIRTSTRDCGDRPPNRCSGWPAG